MNEHVFTFALVLIAVMSLCTSAAELDSDRDGLSDFQEKYKYFTDPNEADTDSDGIPDGDWHERREYTYSVRTVMKVLKPVNISVINDHYQDAQVLDQTDKYIELEVICYPFNKIAASLSRTKEQERGSALARDSLTPGLTTNWDDEMRNDMLAALRANRIDIASMTDVEIVKAVSSWLLKRAKYRYMFGTYFYDFPESGVEILPGLQEAFQREKGNTDLPFDQHLQHELFGKGMYENRSRGTCTSTAVYLTTGLRASGIPTRMILAIPLVDGNDRQQIALVKNGIRHPEMLDKMLEGLSHARGFSAHTFNEVFVGRRWHRLNSNKLGANIDSTFGLMVHVNTFDDLSEANLARTWGWRYGKGERDDIFRTSNPYCTTEVADRVGIHAHMELLKPKPPWEEIGNIRIMSMYWWHNLPKGDWRKGVAVPWRDKSKDAHLLLHVDWRSGTPLGSGELAHMLTKLDRNMYLVNDKGQKLPAQIRTGSVWSNPEGGAELEIVIPKERYSRMVSGTEYTLVPVNPDDHFRWEVADKLSIVKQQ